MSKARFHRVTSPRSAAAAAPALAPDRLLTIKEVSQRLSRSERAVRHLIWRGKLNCIKTDRRIHVSETYLNEWIKKHVFRSTE